jgi:hypothetical protein
MRHAPPFLVTGLCRPRLYSPSRFWASERLTCWANRRHVWGVTRSTGPVRSLVSRTAIRSWYWPTSTHSPPLAPE